MGDHLSKPVTSKHNEHGSGNGLKYGLASTQGWRCGMEDADRAIIGLSDELRDWSFFAVFDGHCGRDGRDAAKISAYCAEHLMECIVNNEDFRKSDFINGIRSGFLHLDNSMRTVPEIGDDNTGTTAVCAFVSPKQIFLANCGDSRAVLRNSGVPTFSTKDHKPSLEAERERIERAGGNVREDRVNGQLAMSRAFGDYEYKAVEGRGPCEQMVSPEPEILVIDRDEKDEFLVIACDGIWDVMSNEEVCNFIRSRLLVTDDLESITNQVLDTCLFKNSKDNMSIILVTFPAAPTPSPEAIEREKNLEQDIERRIIKMISVTDDDEVSFENVLKTLKQEKDYLPDLPFDGETCNIGAKRSFIESKFKLCRDRAYALRVITNQVVDTLLHRGNLDNTSIAVVTFPKASTPSPEAIEKENIPKQVTEKRIISIMVATDRDDVSFDQVLHKLKETDLSDLPSGSDSDTKRSFIESMFKLCRDRADSLKVLTNQPISNEKAKQSDWNESILAVWNNPRLSERQRKFVERLVEKPDIPRKQQKFKDYVSEVLRYSETKDDTIDEVFQLIYNEYKSSKAANSKNNGERKKNSVDSEKLHKSEDVQSKDKSTKMEEKSKTDDGSAAFKVVEKKKKSNKGNVKNENIASEVEIPDDTVQSNYENFNASDSDFDDVSMKSVSKKKLKKLKLQKVLENPPSDDSQDSSTEVESNQTSTAITSLEKNESLDNPEPVKENISKKEVKKRLKKLKFEAELKAIETEIKSDEFTADLENESDKNQNPKKKKRKLDENIKNEPITNETTEATEFEASKKETASKFSWKKVVRTVMEAAEGNEISLKKLTKKIVAEYQACHGEETPYEEVLKKCNEKVAKLPFLKIYNDKVKLRVSD